MTAAAAGDVHGCWHYSNRIMPALNLKIRFELEDSFEHLYSTMNIASDYSSPRARSGSTHDRLKLSGSTRLPSGLK